MIATDLCLSVRLSALLSMVTVCQPQCPSISHKVNAIFRPNYHLHTESLIRDRHSVSGVMIMIMTMISL